MGSLDNIRQLVAYSHLFKNKKQLKNFTKHSAANPEETVHISRAGSFLCKDTFLLGLRSACTWALREGAGLRQTLSAKGPAYKVNEKEKML